MIQEIVETPEAVPAEPVTVSWRLMIAPRQEFGSSSEVAKEREPSGIVKVVFPKVSPKLMVELQGSKTERLVVSRVQGRIKERNRNQRNLQE